MRFATVNEFSPKIQYDAARPSVCNWPAVVPGCGGAAPSPAPAPAVTTTSATPPVTTPAPAPDTEVTEETEVTTEAATTAEAETVTYRPAAGSAYQCSGPGIFNDEDNCNKFWLCKEEPADTGVLQVDRYIHTNEIIFPVFILMKSHISTMRRKLYGYFRI